MSNKIFFGQPDKKFFFEDPLVVAKYVLENYPDECENTIATANEVVEQRFKFNLRWDMERTWDYIVFEDEIDWLHQPGDDPEWIYAFNRMAFWICLGQAYAMTKDEKYAQAFVSQLQHWIKTVPQTCEKAWRSIEVGLRLEYWLKAVCYFKSSPAMTDEVVELFCESIVEHCEFLMKIWNPYNLMSNWGVLANHGMFMAGVMLPESASTKQYAEEAIRRLSLNLQMQVYRDGMQWEQSPMYHNEVLKCYLDVVTLGLRNDIKMPDNVLRQTHDMCYFSMLSAKPDHHEIMMGDSDNVDQRDLLTRGASIFTDEMLKSRAYKKPDFDSVWDMGEAGLQVYESLGTSFPESTDKAFFDSGNFYARSSWDDKATFLHMHCGTLGAGHGHADKLHIDLTSRGEDILVDAGRYTYVFGKDRIRYKELKAHNVLMVDEKDLYVCKDSWECSDLTRGINQRFFSGNRYAYMEGGHLGNYDRGVYVNRRVIFLKPDIVVVADEFYAKGEHSYNQFFHFNNVGSLERTGVVGKECYKYRSDKVRAEMRLIVDEVSSEVAESHISKHYNQEEPSRAVVTSFTGKGFTSAYTVFALSDPEDNRKLEVEKLVVKSTFKGITFSESQIEALNIKLGDQHFTLAVAHEDYASPTDTFNADGCVGFGNCVVFGRSAGETEIGTVLLW